MEGIQNKAFSIQNTNEETHYGLPKTAVASEIPQIKALWLIYCRRFYKCHTTSDCPLDCVFINQACCSHFNSNSDVAAKVKYFSEFSVSKLNLTTLTNIALEKAIWLQACILLPCRQRWVKRCFAIQTRCPPIVDTTRGCIILRTRAHTSTHPRWFWKRAKAFFKPGMAKCQSR